MKIRKRFISGFWCLIFVFTGLVAMAPWIYGAEDVNMELVGEVPSQSGIQIYCIEAMNVLDGNPNEIAFVSRNKGANCGWGTPAAAWKMYLDPNTGTMIMVEFKQTLPKIQEIRQSLFESSDGTLFTGGGWCGYKPPYYSTNGGETWASADTGPHPPNSTFSFGQFKGSVYAGTGYCPFHGQVYRWLGSGSWQLVLDISPPRSIVDAIVEYENKLFVGSQVYWYSTSGCQSSTPVYVSTDGGTFHSTTGIPNCCNVVKLFIVGDQLVAGVINLASGHSKHLYLWDNGSEVWEEIGPFNFDIMNEGLMVALNDIIYIYGKAPGDTLAGIYRSTDLGLNWDRVAEPGNPGVRTMHVHDDMIYLGTYSDAGNKAYIHRLRFNEPPTAVCKNIELAANENCQTYITASDVDGGSYDPDEGDEITLSLDNTGPFSPGTHDVELTVTDQSGESDSCFAQVTVKDQAGPVISIGDPLCVQTGNGKGKMANKLSLTCLDNCSDSVDLQILDLEITNKKGNPVNGNGIFKVIENDIYVYPNGKGWSLTVTVEASDASGNTTVETFFKNLLKCKK